MQNFPTLNWAIQLTHQGNESAVRLPYQEYLAHVAENPEDEQKLEEIRVLIEEPALLPSFKYVSEQINDDHSLALLYKLKRAFSAVQEHGIVDPGNAQDVLEQYIEEVWAMRGLYPGLGSVVSVLADLAEGEPQTENFDGHRLVEAIRLNNPDNDLLDLTFALLEGSGELPEALVNHKRTIRDARAGIRDNKMLIPVLRKLSLFALTSRQIARILFPGNDGLHAFSGRKISGAHVAQNPYLLSESYVPATDQEKENAADMDREQRTDGPIDYFTIDIGMFPDKRYIERNDDLQDLTVTGPERLRAFAIEALRRNETLGHSFAPLTLLVEEAKTHPLFYRGSIVLTEEQLLYKEHLAHFQQRLHVQDRNFFYLQESKDAEDIIARFVRERVELSDLNIDLNWLGSYLNTEAVKISKDISGFEINDFKAERRLMMERGLQSRFYCVTGRPGSGKTQALGALLDFFEKVGENTIVLTSHRQSSATPEQRSQSWREMEGGNNRSLDFPLGSKKISK